MHADWVVAPDAPQKFIEALSGHHPLIAQTLFARGFTDPAQARAFLNGTPDPVDPFALRDMPEAVARIARAVVAGEKIAVYGDYDCDGVSASALLYRTLSSLGNTPRVYIPNRFEEGYGLNSAALDQLKSEGIQLVITVDCGARAVREAAHARAIGLDLIITDHHDVDDANLPKALALVDPKRADCPYSFKGLAGVGVAFRLAQCVLRTLKLPGAVSERALLDLVAIGTIADVVTLRGENRALVRAGLAEINARPRPGVAALMQVAGIRPGTVDAGKIGFTLGPRLNAAGRLESALGAYALLTSVDPGLAQGLAAGLNTQNEMRQTATAQVAAGAEAQVLGDPMPALLFAASADYSAGVIGLAAARLLEKYTRPAVVVTIEGDEARGSCRSLGGFHMTQALDACADLLRKHGGHAAAAGFTVPVGNLGLLAERLRILAAAAQPSDGWRKLIRVDGLVGLETLDSGVAGALRTLEPHGMENPRPVFATRGVTVQSARRVGKADGGPGPHLQLRLRDARGAAWDAIGWRMGAREGECRAGARIDLAFALEENEYRGERRAQLVAQDFAAHVSS